MFRYEACTCNGSIGDCTVLKAPASKKCDFGVEGQFLMLSPSLMELRLLFPFI